MVVPIIMVKMVIYTVISSIIIGAVRIISVPMGLVGIIVSIIIGAVLTTSKMMVVV